MTKEEIEKCKEALSILRDITNSSVIYVSSTLEHTIFYAEYENKLKEMEEEVDDIKRRL